MEEYTQITLDEWTQWKEDIRRKLTETAGNFVYIGYRLKQIRESGMFDGAADIFEFARNEYGLGKSTVSRFIAINEKYSENGNSLELKEEYKKFSSSKLSEMLSLSDSECELITEKTTIKEIRDIKNFSRQQDQIEIVEDDAVITRTPLEKCIIAYFEKEKSTLNRVMEFLNKEEPEYKEAEETMNPSGQNSFKKGIVFLFFYDWNMGVKYKLLTSPSPINLTWPEFLNEIYKIYANIEEIDVWTAFYGEEKIKEEVLDELPEEEEEKKKDSEHLVNTGKMVNSEPDTQRESMPSVATSQQKEKTIVEEQKNTMEKEQELDEKEKNSEPEVEIQKEEKSVKAEENTTNPEEVKKEPEEEPLPDDLQRGILYRYANIKKQAPELVDYLNNMFVIHDDYFPSYQELVKAKENLKKLGEIIDQIIEIEMENNNE